MEHLEQLLQEWYEYQGYFVRRNLWVGLELDGSYECELNLVAFHPVKNHLVHVEPCEDLLSWEEREKHLRLKFGAGTKYLHRMFGYQPRTTIEQLALVVFPDAAHRRSVAGGKVVTLAELLGEVLARLAQFSLAAEVVSEQWPLLRTLQYVAEYRETVCAVLSQEHQQQKQRS